MSFKVVTNILSAQRGAANAVNTSNSALQATRQRNFVAANTTNVGHFVANTDAGNVLHVTTGNVFITTNATFRQGEFFRIYNNSVNTITITQNSGSTLHFHNTTNVLANTLTGNRLIGPRGYVTVTCVHANTYIVHGIGVV